MRHKALKPFFTFYGGKYRAAPHYPPPERNDIIEPFAGSAGYSLRYPENDVILIDLDPAIVATWRFLLTATADDIRSLPDIEPGQRLASLTGYPEGARYLIGWWLNKGTTRPGQTPSSWMRSGIRPNSYWGPAVRNRIASQLGAIRHWRIIHGGYEEAPDIDATWFIDPPYQDAGKHYRFGSNLVDFTSLGEWCQSRKGQVIVCENSGATWLPFRDFRSIKASPAKHGGKRSSEVIWTRAPESL